MAQTLAAKHRAQAAYRVVRTAIPNENWKKVQLERATCNQRLRSRSVTDHRSIPRALCFCLCLTVSMKAVSALGCRNKTRRPRTCRVQFPDGTVITTIQLGGCRLVITYPPHSPHHHTTLLPIQIPTPTRIITCLSSNHQFQISLIDVILTFPNSSFLPAMYPYPRYRPFNPTSRQHFALFSCHAMPYFIFHLLLSSKFETLHHYHTLTHYHPLHYLFLESTYIYMFPQCRSYILYTPTPK